MKYEKGKTPKTMDVVCPSCGKSRSISRSTYNKQMSENKPFNCRPCARKIAMEKIKRKKVSKEAVVINDTCKIVNAIRGKRCTNFFECDSYDKCLDIASRNRWSGWKLVA